MPRCIKFNLNNAESLALRASLMKNKDVAILSQTLAAKHPGVKEAMAGVDLFMPADKFSNHVDNYWLRYNELPQIISRWIKGANIATADNINKYL